MRSWQRQRSPGRQAGSRGINTLGPWDLSSEETDWGRGAESPEGEGRGPEKEPRPSWEACESAPRSPGKGSGPFSGWKVALEGQMRKAGPFLPPKSLCDARPPILETVKWELERMKHLEKECRKPVRSRFQICFSL